MSNKEKKVNPFADSDGGPKKGFQDKFFQWEMDYEEKKLAELPKDEREAIEKDREALAERMRS